MKKTLFLFSIVALSGCSVTAQKWADAEKLCSDFGGVKYVASHIRVASCNNGVMVQRDRGQSL